jgi:hypothetical protein
MRMMVMAGAVLGAVAVSAGAMAAGGGGGLFNTNPPAGSGALNCVQDTIQEFTSSAIVTVRNTCSYSISVSVRDLCGTQTRNLSGFGSSTITLGSQTLCGRNYTISAVVL